MMRWVFGAACFFLLSACGARLPTATPPAPLAALSPTPSLVPSSFPNSAPAPTASPTQCPRQGEIRQDSVDTSAYGRDLPFRIYLPPCYEQGTGGWPALYLLHGLGGDDQTWLALGLADTADRLIKDGSVPGFLIVLPWQRTGLEIEPALLEGLVPYVEENYGALPGPTWRAVGGLSRGGGWAFRLALRYPNVFSAVGLHSPAIRSGDLAALPTWLAQPRWSGTPKIWIDIGDRDSLLPAVDELTQALETRNVAHELSISPGRHEGAYWAHQLETYLRWYGQHW